MKVLVIEDNIELNESIVESLKATDYLCESAHNFVQAEEKVALYEYDVIVVDINLPDGSGLAIIKKVKENLPKTGIIVVSARNSLDNKIEGLELGADDYITKPFDMGELIARIKAIIRRRNFDGNSIVVFDDIAVDVSTRTVKVSEQGIELTKSEYEILMFFLSNPGRVLTRESIAEHIWGDNMDLADSFDFIYSHIKNLRKKIATINGSNPIKAVYGIGYKLESE